MDKKIRHRIASCCGILLLGTCVLGCSFFNGEANAKSKKNKQGDKQVTATSEKNSEQKFADGVVVSTKPTKANGAIKQNVANIFHDVRGIKTPLENVPVEARQYAAVEWKTDIPANEKFIYIDKMTFKLYLIEGNKVIGFCDCALGKNPGQKVKSGDMTTPHGVFPIEEINDASYWSHDFKDGKGEIPNAYGPWFFYLNTYNLSKGNWDGIGIHGTNPDERFVKTVTDDAYHRASEGCIRLLNDNVLKLKEHAKVGMKVVIKGDASN
ncbi:MAG: L,D-transpeptidase [Phascolarctobacterium sp.]|nr:L,D-transpeptidase [Phascolarctobacterium sp.]